MQGESQVPPGYSCGLYCCHDGLSAVTEKRKTCMPYDGTLDFPVLFLITAMNLIALIYGTVQLARQGEIISLRGTEDQNVKMIALVFALVEVTPGFLYLWCALWTSGSRIDREIPIIQDYFLGVDQRLREALLWAPCGLHTPPGGSI